MAELVYAYVCYAYTKHGGSLKQYRARGETGIHLRLRSVSRKGWEFKSPRAHNEFDFFCIYLLARAYRLRDMRGRFEEPEYIFEELSLRKNMKAVLSL